MLNVRTTYESHLSFPKGELTKRDILTLQVRIELSGLPGRSSIAGDLADMFDEAKWNLEE